MVKRLADHSASGDGVHPVRLFGKLPASPKHNKRLSALSFAHRLGAGRKKHLIDLVNRNPAVNFI
jgi:hypothetical protein